MQDFRKVDCWGKAHLLVLRVYRETDSMPPEEMFGMKLQLRRSAVSIPMKIAEGCGRDNNSDFQVDLRRAIASCNELECLVVLAKDLELWATSLSEELIGGAIEVRKMMLGLVKRL